MTDTTIKKIILVNVNSKAQAVGVELIDKRIIKARKEVILSCGAIKTPQILMLSGIGPKPELSKFGINQKIDLPVGQNLHNHTCMGFDFKLKHPEKGLAMGSPAFNNPEYFTTFLPMDWIMALATPEHELQKASQIDGKSSSNDEAPTDSVVMPVYMPFAPPDGTVISNVIVNLVTTSRGSVTLNSSDVKTMPTVDPNTFATEHDRVIYRNSMRTVMKAMESSAGQEFIKEEATPQGEVTLTQQSSDEDLDDRAKKYMQLMYHFGGTAAMGSVVDTSCKVKGIEGLRVVDASILPYPLSGLLQGPMYGVAENAANIIIIDHQ